MFPGGNYDEGDGSYRVTAIRETFEETGLLLAQKKCSIRGSSASEQSPAGVPKLNQDALNRARQSILLGQTVFSKFLSGSGLTPTVDELLPFTEWITPVQAPRCVGLRFRLLSDTCAEESDVFLGPPADGFMPGFILRSYGRLLPLAFFMGPNGILSPPLMVAKKSSPPDSSILPKRCEPIGITR